ncbi:LpxI family protein [Sneathiella glossodoripedis]|uniref:LpxI family protein n=1 Tax=Sneathiella glossodoripedis TaxID=418853 RepID=UPI00046F3E15|nr:UDP-2,3-diacylglucosamine diphosphatase LpxI [Sneathiella glossodoripedis]
MASANLNEPAFKKIGLIAGRGNLPVELVARFDQTGQPFRLLLVEGEASPNDFSAYDHDVVPITKIGQFLRLLKKHECTHVMMAGPVNRPNFKNIFPDKDGFRLLRKIGTSFSKGDDGLLRAITEFVEKEGFKIVGAHEFDTALTSQLGTLGKVEPTEEQREDIVHGIRVAKALGQYDIGQAVVVRSGYVLAVEAAEGTSRMIERCGDFKWDNQPAGVLVKMAKTDQELRVDMPAIGALTVQSVAQAGLCGIAIEAEKTLLINRDEIISEADRLGIFVEAFSEPQQ